MGKKVDKKQAFLTEYQKLKASGKDFVFTTLAFKYGFTRNQARGIVGGSAKGHSDRLLPKRRPGRPKYTKKTLTIPKIHESDVNKVVDAVEKAVEAATGSKVKAEISKLPESKG